jgi:hypothetical protein
VVKRSLPWLLAAVLAAFVTATCNLNPQPDMPAKRESPGTGGSSGTNLDPGDGAGHGGSAGTAGGMDGGVPPCADLADGGDAEAGCDAGSDAEAGCPDGGDAEAGCGDAGDDADASDGG